MKILDCTLRDGGYYTNWDFDKELTHDYYKLIKTLPIDIVEIGYRGNPNKKNSYLGEFYFLTKSNLKKIKHFIGIKKKISIMVDTKDWDSPSELYKNLYECKKLVDIVRFAVNPNTKSQIKKFLAITKKLGFTVCVNLMYSHLILHKNEILKNIFNLKPYFDVLYIVDSYGSLVNGDITNIIKKIRAIDTKCKLGFHSHNNLELAFSNSLEAINEKIDYLDCTITGMGRGAGNLKTELLLTYLNLKNKILKLNEYKNLANVVGKFEEIKLKEQWGTSLPYMISGSTETPQAEAMRLIKSKRYNLSDIATYLSKGKIAQTQITKFLNWKEKEIIIIGGGASVKRNINYFLEYLNKNKKIFIIFCGGRYLDSFKNIKNRSIICVTGNEINKIKHKHLKYSNFLINNVIDEKTILPKKIKNFYKVRNNNLKESINNSLLAISLAGAKNLKAQKIFLIGFDGYNKSQKINDYSLNTENQKIFDYYRKKLKLTFLTDTIYENVNKSSIFKLLN